MPWIHPRALCTSTKFEKVQTKKSPVAGASLCRAIERLLSAGANHFDFHAAVLGAAFSGLVVSHWLLFALAFGVHAVLFDALGHQVSLDGFGTADRQLLVVSIGAHGVGVTHGDDDFQVDALDLGDQVVQLGLAFCLQHRLVEVEECVSSVGHLAGHDCGSSRRRCSSGRCWSSARSWSSGGCGSWSRDGAIAAWSSGGWRPVGIAPAVFVGAVLPDQLARSISPVVNGLGASGGCERCRGKQHRHFVQFLHGSPLGEKAAASLRIRTLEVTITQSVQTIVPYVTRQKRPHRIGARRTKP